MIADIAPSVLCGSVVCPPSKSVAHRDLICAALACGESRIENVAPSQDILATLRCLNALGTATHFENGCVTVYGNGLTRASKQAVFDCGESGSTLRFIIPLALLLGLDATYIGSTRLLSRPLSVYEEIAKQQGWNMQKTDTVLEISGKLTAGDFSVSGNVSSQFITGLLFALPMLDGESTLTVLPPFESRSYALLTLDVLRKFGVSIDYDGEYSFTIKGGQRYIPQKLSVEGDYSNAAFLDVFNFLGGEVTLSGLNPDSLQGDRIYKQYFETLCKSASEIDITDCPDLGPVLMAFAALKYGGTLVGTKRLAVKESDRGRVMSDELAKLGADIVVRENSITVNKSKLMPCDRPLCGHNDHRIVMALATVLTTVGGKIEGCEAVKKSFPDYFEKIGALGGKVKLYDR